MRQATSRILLILFILSFGLGLDAKVTISKIEYFPGEDFVQLHMQTDKILPIPDIPHVGLTTYDAKDPDMVKTPIEQLRPPDGAPNVLIVLLDDCGFGKAERGLDAALSAVASAGLGRQFRQPGRSPVKEWNRKAAAILPQKLIIPI